MVDLSILIRWSQSRIGRKFTKRYGIPIEQIIIDKQEIDELTFWKDITKRRYDPLSEPRSIKETGELLLDYSLFPEHWLRTEKGVYVMPFVIGSKSYKKSIINNEQRLSWMLF